MANNPDDFLFLTMNLHGKKGMETKHPFSFLFPGFVEIKEVDKQVE